MPQICSKLHQVLKPDFAIQMTKKRQYSSTQFFFFCTIYGEVGTPNKFIKKMK